MEIILEAYFLKGVKSQVTLEIGGSNSVTPAPRALVPVPGMDWLINLSQKIIAFLDSDAMMPEEDPLDFFENQLQTVSNSIENQYQTVSANIENKLQRIRGNIQQCCSAVKLGGVNYQLADAGNINFDSTTESSSLSSLDLFRDGDYRLADVENEKIKPIAPKSPMNTTKVNSEKELEQSPISLDDSAVEPTVPESSVLCIKIDSGKGLDKSSTVVDSADDADSKLADGQNENIEPIDPESSMLSSEFNYVKGLGVSFSFLDESDSDDSFVSSGTLPDTDSSIPGVQCADHKEMGGDAQLEDLTCGCFIGQNVYEMLPDEVSALLDSDKICHLCFEKFKSNDKEKISCESCSMKMKSIDLQDCEQQPPLNTEATLDTADFDADWEII